MALDFRAEGGVVGVGKEDGHAAGAEDGVGVVGVEFVHFAVFIGEAGVEGEADAGARHGVAPKGGRVGGL